ncbi:hypothetical protein ACIHCQ_39490 [Streptomyces sp. NPDC052236]|uniref:hypothetical protein n=1 Tax=Streptomyces sp. NPDC052236 TaxID=3365686 RepID=UPI0037CD658D
MTEFSTGVVAAPERFALWEEVTERSHMRNRLRSNDHDDFRARTGHRGVASGDFLLTRSAFIPQASAMRLKLTCTALAMEKTTEKSRT